MPTNFDNQWKFIAGECINRIKANNTASIRSVIHALQSEGKLKKDVVPTVEDLLIIEGFVIKNKNYRSDRYDEQFHVTFSNKNFFEKHPTTERIALLLLGTILSLLLQMQSCSKQTKQGDQVQLLKK